ncbi:MAG: GNAT family N-acetyltransferase [Actinomycetota bacterium]|nr:GNAT family N-acetyltransferase [Actinomycetota bacterium]
MASGEKPGVAFIRPARAAERGSIREQLRNRWGSPTIVTGGRARDASSLPALVAAQGEEIVGLATYELSDRECELITLDAFRSGTGIGSALLSGVRDVAFQHGCVRLWLITTNDNLDALRFYQRRGMRLVAVHQGAVDAARRLKPAIPLTGEHGIPIHDELELELELN